MVLAYARRWQPGGRSHRGLLPLLQVRAGHPVTPAVVLGEPAQTDDDRGAGLRLPDEDAGGSALPGAN